MMPLHAWLQLTCRRAGLAAGGGGLTVVQQHQQHLPTTMTVATITATTDSTIPPRSSVAGFCVPAGGCDRGHGEACTSRHGRAGLYLYGGVQVPLVHAAHPHAAASQTDRRTSDSTAHRVSQPDARHQGSK